MHANTYPHQRFDKTNLYNAQAALVILLSVFIITTLKILENFQLFFMLENIKFGLNLSKDLIIFSYAPFFMFHLSCCMPVSVVLETASEIPVEDSTHPLWCSHLVPVCCSARLVAGTCIVYTARERGNTDDVFTKASKGWSGMGSHHLQRMNHPSSLQRVCGWD